MKKNNKGFTLMEVLVSIVIVGLVLVCVIILSSTSSKASNKSKLNSNIAYALDDVFNQFTVDPEKNFTTGNYYSVKYYYDEMFTLQTDKSSDYYILAQGTVEKEGYHYKCFKLVLSAYVRNEDTSDGANTSIIYPIYDTATFERSARIEVF